ncbi:MAG: nitrous oxide reductase family maturation protein NosD [Candidatus Hermodarchaeota archaeon]
MTSNAKLHLVFIGLFFVFSLILDFNLCCISYNNNKSLSYTNNFTSDTNSLKLSDVSERIHINNNWTAAETAGICTGNGSYSDPYIVKDLEIDGGGLGSCILIENSTAYFKIENCSLYNSGGYQNAGIKLNNVTKGKLALNNCTSINYYGIYLTYCDNNTILGNTVNSDQNGIYLDNCFNNLISENIVINNSYKGIFLTNSNYNTISGNIVNSNKNGIYLDNCCNNLISENIVNYNSYDGIILINSDYNTISGNTAKYNYNYGIYLYYSCDYNTISGNTSNNNSHGIYLTNCVNNIISGNNLSYNINKGMELFSSSYNNIIGNNASFNGDTGIRLIDSLYNIVSGNILIGNKECIAELNCHGNTFSDNGDCTYGQENPLPAISGYNLFLLIGVFFVVSIIIIKKLKKF